MFMEVVPVPNAFVAVIVWFMPACVELGVPLISQLVLFILKPVGNAGEIVHEDKEFPVSEAVMVVIAEFKVNVNGEPE